MEHYSLDRKINPRVERIRHKQYLGFELMYDVRLIVPRGSQLSDGALLNHATTPNHPQPPPTTPNHPNYISNHPPTTQITSATTPNHPNYISNDPQPPKLHLQPPHTQTKSTTTQIISLSTPSTQIIYFKMLSLISK